MDNNEIRRKILEILYDIYFENPQGGIINDGWFQTKLQIDEGSLNSNILYLRDKGYVDIESHSAVLWYSAKITDSGIDIVENNEEFDRQFPISVTQNIITNSHGVVINSSNASINIQDAFNKIYQQIDDENPENKDEIIEKINELKQELQKENISKTKLQSIYDWLNRNANWTIPSIVQIVTAYLFGGG